MKAKLLSDETLREDLYTKLMFTAVWLTNDGVNGDDVRAMIEKQIDFLMPTVKKHIKRHKRAYKESLNDTRTS